MTIKEIEDLSGMTRANIRFYEAQGLLSPARGANGYRDYSAADLDALRRIKLLRTLRLPLEEIKALHAGEDELGPALERHIAALELERDGIGRSERVCREMRDDGADYPSLDAQRYLDALGRRPEEPSLAGDTLPPVGAPWRRLFARGLDIFLYSALWNIFLTSACHVNVNRMGAGVNLLGALMCILIMIFIEPLLLTLLGTTAGKWMMGLSVANDEGGRLTYSAALSRTWTVFFRGMGLNVPIYHLVRLWKSYCACDSGETLEWEYDSVLSLRDERGWRWLALICAHAALICLLTLAISSEQMPRHRGDITPAEFCDNFRRLAGYYGVDYGARLDDSGKWIENDDGGYAIHIGGDIKTPDIAIAESGGYVTGVSFSFETSDSTVWPPSCQEQMALCALSLACTQKDFGAFSGERKALLGLIESHPFESYSFEEGGISAVCRVEYSGYEDYGVSSGYLFPREGADTLYSLTFSISKTD